MSQEITHSDNHHVQPIKMYLSVFVALVFLMVATIAVSRVEALKEYTLVNNMIAMGIATTKAVLVILFFMGVKFSSNLTKIFVLLGFSWFFMLFFTMCDYMTRSWEVLPGWEGKQHETAMSRDSRWRLPSPR